MPLNTSYVSSAVLQARDVRVLSQLHHGVQRQLQARVGRHVVQNHRHRAAVRHLQGRHTDLSRQLSDSTEEEENGFPLPARRSAVNEVH